MCVLLLRCRCSRLFGGNCVNFGVKLLMFLMWMLLIFVGKVDCKCVMVCGIWVRFLIWIEICDEVKLLKVLVKVVR